MLGEDADSVATHIKTMQDELNRACPNLTVVDDRMDQTLAARRQAISSMKLQDILEIYPALTLDSQVFCRRTCSFITKDAYIIISIHII